jgi:PAS domain-containing protein
MDGDSLAAVRDAARLAALWRLALLDTPADAAFDRLTRLAARLLAAPVALVSLVDADRQFFKSGLGLREPWASRRETPLSHSFCQHAVAARAPLAIEDARAHPLVRDSPAIPDLGVVAYLGVPLVTAEDHALGTLCVLDSRPRRWSAEETALLTDLADLTMAEIERHGHAHEAARAHRELAARLREQEALVALLAGGLPALAFACDAGGTVTRCVGGGLAGLGLTPSELVGQGAADPAQRLAGWAATVRDALAGAPSTTRQAVDGRLVETAAVPLHDGEGRVMGAVGVLREREGHRPG